MKITVNGREEIVDGPTVSYEDAVRISGVSGADLYTVTYSRTAREIGTKYAGVLAPGGFVKVRDGTIFNVSDTSNA